MCPRVSKSGSDSKRTMRVPSAASTSSMCAVVPAIGMTAPGRVRLPGRAKARQRPSGNFSNTRISIFPSSVSRRAGMTRELLSTSRSPSRMYSGRSRNARCEMVPAARSTTIMREAARSGRGREAISSRGRSKS